MMRLTVILLYTMLCVLTVSNTHQLFQQFQLENVTAFQKLIVDPTSGDLIVGGTNAILRLNTKFELLDYGSTGPRPAEACCGDSCSRGNMTDSSTQLLLLYPSSARDSLAGSLLYCGSAQNGRCAVISSHQLKNQNYLNTCNGLNRVSANTSVSGFFGRAGRENEIVTLYIGQEYDPQTRMGVMAENVSISGRYLEPVPGNRYNISFVYEDLHHRTAKDIANSEKATYRVRYIHSFSHNNFTYWVTVQRRSLVPDTDYSTRLVRVSQEDNTYFSYTEVELFCRKKNGYISFFNIAIDAHVGPIGKTFSEKFELSPTETGLYILSGKSAPGGDYADPDYGSGVCLFKMSTVEEAFQSAQGSCYSGKGALLSWIHPMEPACTHDDSVYQQIADDPLYNGRESKNDAIGSRYPYTEDSNATLYTLATALTVVIQGDDTVAVLATSNGRLLKVKIDGKNSKPYLNLTLPEEPGPALEISLDHSHQHAYVLSASKLTRVALDSCAVYKTCGECVLSSDPLGCGWCDGRCDTQHGCMSSADWSQNTCRPTITQFSPTSGPAEGGTTLTIHGYDFGNCSNSSPSSCMVKVRLDKQLECTQVTRQFTKLTCVVPPLTTSRRRDLGGKIITVEVIDKTSSSVPYDIKGSTVALQAYVYKRPKITSLAPSFGPVSGGTKVTVIGSDLDIGSNVTVMVAGEPCRVVLYESGARNLVCITPAHRPLQAGVVGVSVGIDNFHHSTLNFTYKHDPVITDVQPRKSTVSGGIRITVHGRELMSVASPQLELHCSNVTLQSQCHLADEQHFTCESPSALNHVHNLAMSCSLGLVMDGVPADDLYAPTLQNRNFTYFPDPVLMQLDSKTLDLDIKRTRTIMLKGEQLTTGAALQDYDIMIGQFECHMITLTRTTLTCQVHMDDSCVRFRPMNIKVEVGRLVFSPGQLRCFEPSKATVIILLIAITFVCLILGVVIVVIVCWKRSNSRRKRVPSTPVHFSPTTEYLTMEDHAWNTYWTYPPQSPSSEQLPLMNTEWWRQLEDYKLYIEREQLLLLEVIGQGNFGCVHHGILKEREEKQETDVAVKTLKSLSETPQVNPSEVHKFLEEALRMREFEHPNVMRLIGIALEADEQPLVVLPYMKHGDLLTYIRDPRNSPKVKDLMEFGIQIAQGMAYLAKLKFVHRDLAARNCMLDDNMIVQVADFGLSRDIYERDYYTTENRKARLPVKWMALESLEKGIYSVKSDVWSYGVVVWELMTRGVNPYPEVDNWDIIKFLRCGRRMPQPAYCPDQLYSVVIQCWDPDPTSRPDFVNIVETIYSIMYEMELQQQMGDATVDASSMYVNVPVSQTYLYPQVPSHYAIDRANNDSDSTSESSQAESPTMPTSPTRLLGPNS